MSTTSGFFARRELLLSEPRYLRERFAQILPDPVLSPFGLMAGWGTIRAMDDTTKRTIERISVRYPNAQTIPSGQVASVFYDCYQLSPSDLARLAADALGDIDHDIFDIAVGRAYSGILFAAAVAGGKKVGILQKDGSLFGPDLKGLKVIVVDDVVHTGAGIIEAASIVERAGGIVVGFACIVDRSGGQFAGGVSTASGARPLFSAFQTDME